MNSDTTSIVPGVVTIPAGWVVFSQRIECVCCCNDPTPRVRTCLNVRFVVGWLAAVRGGAVVPGPRFATGNVVSFVNGQVVDVRQMSGVTKLTADDIQEVYPFTLGGQAKTLCVARPASS